MKITQLLLVLSGAAIAAPPFDQPVPALARRVEANQQYVPVAAKCPSTPLVRKADGISSPEAAYVSERKKVASYALRLFLQKTKAKFPLLDLDDYPTVALLTSGGGLRSLLIGAGVHKAFDGREGLAKYSTAGLYQCMTYEAGLSGGAWLVSSIAAANYPTISKLQSVLYSKTFDGGPIGQGGGTNNGGIYDQIKADVAAKQAAGFNVSIVDGYGREIAYEILRGRDGGVYKQFSDIATLSNFTNHLAPFPIITSLGVNTALDQCDPMDNATQYEVSPYEFGSWDQGIAAFTPTKYLGSSLNNGVPTSRAAKACIKRFDASSFLFGTSSDIFPAVSCPSTSFAPNMSTAPPLNLVPLSAQGKPEEVFGRYPNPFFGFSHSSTVAAAAELTLADGGLGNQNNPIWPFLHRPDVSVLVVNDNSADTNQNYPNGVEIYTTYVQAKAAGLGARMPVIPSSDVFLAKGLNTRPTVFGCRSASPQQLTIVFLPNQGYNGYNSGKSTFMLSYSASDVDAMIDNGALVGSYGQMKGWDTCMGCFTVKKTMEKAGKALPSACDACFTKFCYN